MIIIIGLLSLKIAVDFKIKKKSIFPDNLYSYVVQLSKHFVHILLYATTTSRTLKDIRNTINTLEKLDRNCDYRSGSRHTMEMKKRMIYSVKPTWKIQHSIKPKLKQYKPSLKMLIDPKLRKAIKTNSG